MMKGHPGQKTAEAEDLLLVTRKNPVAAPAAEIQGGMAGVASLPKARTNPANLPATDKSNLVLLGKTNGRLAIAIEAGKAKLASPEPNSQIEKTC